MNLIYLSRHLGVWVFTRESSAS